MIQLFPSWLPLALLGLAAAATRLCPGASASLSIASPAFLPRQPTCLPAAGAVGALRGARRDGNGDGAAHAESTSQGAFWTLNQGESDCHVLTLQTLEIPPF